MERKESQVFFKKKHMSIEELKNYAGKIKRNQKRFYSM